MKKKIFLILILIMITTLVSCKKETKKGCEHTFQEATCTQAKTCSKCGTTKGEALGHTFQEATCTQAKTCSRCGATEGEALGHAFQEATCQAPKTCSRCGATEGEKLQHKYVMSELGIYTCAYCNKFIFEILGKNYFLNKFSEMDGCKYEKVNYCSFGGSPYMPVLDSVAKYKLLKEKATYDEETEKYIVPIMIERTYALDKNKGEAKYYVQSAKPGKTTECVTLEELNSNYNIFVTISKEDYEKLADIDTIIATGTFRIDEEERVGNDITEEFHISINYLFEESISIEEPTIKLSIDLGNFSYIKDGKFYINNNEHLELTAQYYYQALKDGMSSEEFDKWAFVANYRRIMRLLDPTSLDLSK